MSASVESCEKQVFLHEDAEEYLHHLSRFERSFSGGCWTDRRLKRWQITSISQLPL